MMMPGHTHEDIDSMFRFIADALRSKGLVRTIDEFVEASTHAFKDQPVHVEHISYVFDYENWLRPNMSEFSKITTARYFVIGLRERDRRAVMWYKPSAGHEHLYPTKKDDITHKPIYYLEDGERKYETDMDGIEMLVGSPIGEPAIQPFENDRMDVSNVHAAMKQIMSQQPHLFGEQASAWWDVWASTTITDAEAAYEANPLPFTWPAKADKWRPPTLSGLRSEYSETVTYLNTAGGQAFSIRDARQAAAEENDAHPALGVGDLLVVKPGSDDGMHHLPFWVAEVFKEVGVGEEPVEVVWRSAFKGGYARDDIDGQWLRICIGNSAARGGCVRYHAYGSQCRVGGKDKAGHGHMCGTIMRDEVALYFAKLTPKHSHMCVKSAPNSACVHLRLTHVAESMLAPFCPQIKPNKRAIVEAA